MGTVISFPTTSVRDWLVIERAMKDELQRLGISEATQLRLIGVMKSFFETLDFKFDLSVAVEFPGMLSKEQTSAICSDIRQKIGERSSTQLQIFTKQLFFDRLHREIELCRELGIW